MDSVQFAAFQQCLRSGIERFFYGKERVGGRNGRPHADEAFHAAAFQHIRHFRIKFLCGNAGLENVGEYERAPFRGLFLGAAVHEVEGNVECGGVRIIGVVDKRAAPHALHHFEAHGHGFEQRHAPRDVGRREAEVEADAERRDAVLYRGFIGEGEGVFGRRAVEKVGDARFPVFCRLDGAYEDRGIFVFPRPTEQLAAKAEVVHALRYHWLVGIVNQHLCIFEEQEFLVAFLLYRRKVFLMCGTDVGHHADGRLDNGTQRLHLARLRYACFKNADAAALVEQPDRERHAHLRVVTAGRARHVHRKHQQLVDPFLHNCFAVRAGDANDGQNVLLSVSLGEALQGFEGTEHAQEISIGIVRLVIFGHRADHEIAHAPAVEVGDIFVSVAHGSAEGEEKGCFGESQ